MLELLKQFDAFCRETIELNSIDFSVVAFENNTDRDEFILKHFAHLIDIILGHIPEYGSKGDQHMVMQLKLIAYQHLEDYKQRIYKTISKDTGNKINDNPEAV